MADLYFLKKNDGPYELVTRSEWITAERNAGFYPKPGLEQATAGFATAHVRGRTVDLTYFDPSLYEWDLSLEMQLLLQVRELMPDHEPDELDQVIAESILNDPDFLTIFCNASNRAALAKVCEDLRSRCYIAGATCPPIIDPPIKNECIKSFGYMDDRDMTCFDAGATAGIAQAIVLLESKIAALTPPPKEKK